MQVLHPHSNVGYPNLLKFLKLVNFTWPKLIAVKLPKMQKIYNKSKLLEIDASLLFYSWSILTLNFALITGQEMLH